MQLRWAGGALLALTHAAPALSRSRPLRARLWPELAGDWTDRSGGAESGRGRHVALTFDDGPDPAGTPVVTAALAQLGWHATFFCLGSQAAQHPQLVAELVAAGHEVGVHGFSHRSHLLRSPAAVYTDMRRARDILGDITGVTPRWFRPPYGVLSGGTVVAARRLALRTVLWTTWGHDWSRRTPEQVAAAVLANLAGGGTVLLHDSSAATRTPAAWRSTAAALPLLHAALASTDWQVGPLREHVLP